MIPDGRTLVTGAGGFIGGRVVETIAQEDPDAVVAGVRTLSNGARVARFPVDLREVDVLEPESVISAFEDVDRVVHCAAGGPDVIRDGTRNVLEASEAENVERVVHLSSVDVYDDQEGPLGEQSPLREPDDTYGGSKVASEQVCRRFDDRDVDIVRLRPSIVYGPFAGVWIESIVPKLRAGRLGRSDAFSGYCNPVYVDDVVQAILRVLQSNVAGEAFNVSGDEVFTWSEYFDHLSSAIGWGDAPELSRAHVWAEASLAHPLRLAGQQAMSNHEDAVLEATSRSSILKSIARDVRSLIEATPSLSELRLFRRRATYPIEKAKKRLGFEPATSLSEGMEITADWLHHHRLV